MDRVWRILISVRLTITLLLLMTAFSVVGTLIAQQATASAPLESIYSPETLKWLVRFGLTDIFHSGYFVALILSLALNLIACSIERLPGVWRQAFHTPPKRAPEAVFGEWSEDQMRAQKFLCRRMPLSEGNPAAARARARLFLEKTGLSKRASLLQEDAEHFEAYVERGKYSRVGVYITHLSLLLIMAGSVLGAVFGFDGVMQIEEGTRASWIQHNKGSRQGMRPFRENGVPVRGVLGLPFEVECQRFTLETYDGSRPKLFKSVLGFYENDVKVATREISVNNPTVYKGLTFYQASFVDVGAGKADLKVFRVAQAGSARMSGREPNAEKRRAAPSLAGKMPKIDSIEPVADVRPGELYRVDGDGAFRVTQLEKDLMQLGPAARVQYFETRATKKPREFWIFKNLPGFDFAHRRGARLHFVLEDLKPKYATGLAVARDPGVWVVWVGCAILVLALFIALYTFQSRVWVRCSPQGVYLVGWSNKLFLFEPKFEKMAEQLSGEFKK